MRAENGGKGPVDGLLSGPCGDCRKTIPEGRVVCPFCGACRDFNPDEYRRLRQHAGTGRAHLWEPRIERAQSAGCATDASLIVPFMAKHAGLCAVGFEGADLRGLDLKGVDLSAACLDRADLSGATLREAILTWANLEEANLSGTDLTGAILSFASLKGAQMANARLSDADLSGTNLADANLQGVDVVGTELSEPSSTPRSENPTPATAGKRIKTATD